MKILFFSLLTVLLFTMQTAKKQKLTQTIQLQVFYTESYCNGMRPTQEMLDELALPKPYPKRELWIVKGKTGKGTFISKLITNEKGICTTHLPKGRYSIVDNQKKIFLEKVKNNKSDYQISSDSCVNEWITKPVLTFTVAKNSVLLTHTFNKSCYLGENPVDCISYNGPQKP